MEKLPMCRLCFVENVQMYVVVNKNLQALYEKLTDVPFVTEDKRPMLACFFCCTKLKQCWQLQRKCLEAEKLFSRMLNEDYETNSQVNQDRLQFNGFVISPTEYFSISGECQTDSVIIKEELPGVCERQDDENQTGVPGAMKPKLDTRRANTEDSIATQQMKTKQPVLKIIRNAKNQSKQKCQDIEYLQDNLQTQLETEDISPHHSESDSEDDIPLTKFITEAEEEEISKRKRQAKKTTRAAGVTKTDKTKQPVSKIIRNAKNRTSRTVTNSKKLNSNNSLSNDLNKRIQIHTGEKPYKCEICQRSYNQKCHLTQHIRLHNGERPFKCEICQRSFSLKDPLKRHIRLHIGDKPFKCDICRRGFTRKDDLIKHIRVHTGEKPYKCEICQRVFSENSHLTRHIRVHTGEKPYKCDICQRGFARKVNLTRHILVHTNEKPYKCSICQRSFSQKIHFTSHNCRFSEKSNLTKHKRVHTGKKLYKCEICQCTFNQKRHLTQHLRVHIGDKPYKCDICQRSFTLKNHLKQHIRVHIGTKLYSCDICHRSFTNSSKLTRHIRVHTGEKPYKCEICQRSFTQKGTLTTHIRVHTRGKTLQL